MFMRVLFRLSTIVASAFVLPLLTGCADTFTFANRSNAEGMALYRNKAYGDAAGAFRNAIRQDPRHYESHLYLALCYDHLGQHQQAFMQYRTTLDVMANTIGGRNDSEFRQSALDAYANSVARYDQGDVELNKIEARAKNAKNGEDPFLLAKIYRIRGDADSALRWYRQAANWDSKDFLVRKEAGLYLAQLNQPKEAEYYLRMAYMINANDPEVKGELIKMGVLPQPAPTAEPPQEASAPANNAPTMQKTVVAPRD
jgi:Flp pilus assembly protein TadD